MKISKQVTVALAAVTLLASCHFENICVAAESIDISNVTCYGNETVCADKADACVWSWGRCAHRCDLHDGNTTRCAKAQGCLSLANGTCVQNCLLVSASASLGCSGANLSHCMNPGGFVATSRRSSETCLPRCSAVEDGEKDVCSALGCNYLAAGPHEGSCALDCVLYGTDTAGCEASGVSSGLQCMMQTLTSGSSVCLPNCSAAQSDIEMCTAVSGYQQGAGVCNSVFVDGSFTCQVDCQMMNLLAPSSSLCASSQCEVAVGVSTRFAPYQNESCSRDCSRISNADECINYPRDCEWTGGQCVTACSLFVDCEMSAAVSARCVNVSGDCRTRCEVLDQTSCRLSPHCVRLSPTACGYNCDALNATTNCLTDGRDAYCMTLPDTDGTPRCLVNCSALTEVDCDLEVGYCRRPSETSQNRCSVDCANLFFGDGLCDDSSCQRVTVSAAGVGASQKCVQRCDQFQSRLKCLDGGSRCGWSEQRSACELECAGYGYGAACPAGRCRLNSVSGACEVNCASLTTTDCLSHITVCDWDVTTNACITSCASHSVVESGVALSGRSFEAMQSALASSCTGTCLAISNNTQCVVNCPSMSSREACEVLPSCTYLIGDASCDFSCSAQRGNCYGTCGSTSENSTAADMAQCSRNCTALVGETTCAAHHECHWESTQQRCVASCSDVAVAAECPSHCHADANAIVQCSEKQCFDRSENACKSQDLYGSAACMWSFSLTKCLPLECTKLNEADCLGAPDRKCLFLADVKRCVPNCTTSGFSDALCPSFTPRSAGIDAAVMLDCPRMKPDLCSTQAGCRLATAESGRQECRFNCALLTSRAECSVQSKGYNGLSDHCDFVFNSTCVSSCSTVSSLSECRQRPECHTSFAYCALNCSAIGDAERCARTSGCEVIDTDGSCAPTCSSLHSMHHCLELGTHCAWSGGTCVTNCSHFSDAQTCASSGTCRYVHSSATCVPACTTHRGRCSPGTSSHCQVIKTSSSAYRCAPRCSSLSPIDQCSETSSCVASPISTNSCSLSCSLFNSQDTCPSDRCTFAPTWASGDDVRHECRPRCSQSTSKQTCSSFHCDWVDGTCRESCFSQNCSQLAHCDIGATNGGQASQFPRCTIKCAALTSAASCEDHNHTCVYHQGQCKARCSGEVVFGSGRCSTNECAAIPTLNGRASCHRNCTGFTSEDSCSGPSSISGECIWLPLWQQCGINCEAYEGSGLCPATHCERHTNGSCTNIGEQTPAPSTAPITTTAAPTTTEATAPNDSTQFTSPTSVDPSTTESPHASTPVPTTETVSTVEASIVLAGTHWADVIGSPNASLLEDDLRQDLAVYTSVNLTQVVISETGVRGGLAVNFTIANVTNVSAVVAFLEAIGAASPQSAFPATLSRYEASSAGAAAEVRVLSSTAAAVTVPPAPTETPPGEPVEQTLLEGSTLSAGAVLLIILAVSVVLTVAGVVGFGMANGGLKALSLRLRRSPANGGNDTDDSLMDLLIQNSPPGPLEQQSPFTPPVLQLGEHASPQIIVEQGSVGEAEEEREAAEADPWQPVADGERVMTPSEDPELGSPHLLSSQPSVRSHSTGIHSDESGTSSQRAARNRVIEEIL